MIRILFADDQIPEYDIPESKISQDEREMRKAVQKLKDAGYHVDVARTLKESIDQVKKKRYDIAIIDLGWYYDKSVSSSEQPTAGWEICRAVTEANEALLASKLTKGRMKPTFQIMHSQRLMGDATITMTAASRGALPVFKSYNQASHEALVAAVKFVEENAIEKSIEEVRKTLAIRIASKTTEMMMQQLGTPLEEQRKWFNLTFTFVAASVALLLIGVITVIFGNLPVGTLSSLGSIISGIISALLFRHLHKSQASAKENRKEIEDFFDKTVMPQIESVLKSTSSG
ncbi:MAG: response regulator [Candidatus Thorarchaeota archaeon]|nr:MAG: response regulator [Candidatus Thorarchaeota archaeon]